MRTSCGGIWTPSKDERGNRIEGSQETIVSEPGQIVLPNGASAQDIVEESRLDRTGRDRESRNRRDSVMLVVVPNDRRMAPRIPSPAAHRDQHEAALIEEGEVGGQSSRFFL
jgi:hypothetical protein